MKIRSCPRGAEQNSDDRCIDRRRAIKKRRSGAALQNLTDITRRITRLRFGLRRCSGALQDQDSRSGELKNAPDGFPPGALRACQRHSVEWKDFEQIVFAVLLSEEKHRPVFPEDLGSDQSSDRGVSLRHEKEKKAK